VIGNRSKIESSKLNPSGLCQCGCGRPAPLAPKTMTSRGWTKGEAVRYILGHSGRTRPSGIIRFTVDSGTGCWLWAGSLQPNGYGHLTIQNRQVLAHCYTYERLRGPIPDGYELDHLCRNPRCINPDHLEPVTHAENCRRGVRAKLDGSQVIEIRQLAAEGVSRSDIAQQFGVHVRTIRAVVTGEAWC